MKRKQSIFLYRGFVLGVLVALLFAATQTINTVPDRNATFLADLQTFLQDEIGTHNFQRFAGTIIYGGHDTGAAGLAHTVNACLAFPDGYYVSAAAESKTYTDDTDTWVYVDQDDAATRTVGGCNVTRGTEAHLLFVECATAAPTPATPLGCIPLMKVAAAAGALTTTDLRVGDVPLEVLMGTAASFKDALETNADRFSAERRVTIGEPITANANTTIPNTVHLHIKNGGMIVTSTFTITSNALVTTVGGGIYQIFDTSGGGSVVLPSEAEVYPEQWGAAADDSTDDADELQAAIDSTGRVVLRANTGYATDTALVMDNAGQDLDFRNGAYVRQTTWGLPGFVVAAAYVGVYGRSRVEYTGARADLPNLSGNAHCCDTCEKEYCAGFVLTSAADDFYIEDGDVYGQVSGIGGCYNTSQDYIENVHIDRLKVAKVDFGIVGKVWKNLYAKIDSSEITYTQAAPVHAVYITQQSDTASALEDNENVRVFVAHDGTDDDSDADLAGIVSFKDCKNCTADIKTVHFGNSSTGTWQLFISNTGGTGTESEVFSTGSVTIVATEDITSSGAALVAIAYESDFVLNNLNISATVQGANSSFVAVVEDAIVHVQDPRLINTMAHEAAQPSQFFYIDATAYITNPIMKLANDDYATLTTEVAIYAADEAIGTVKNPEWSSVADETAALFYAVDGSTVKLQYDPNMVQANVHTEVIRDQNNNSANLIIPTNFLVTPRTLADSDNTPILGAANVLLTANTGAEDVTQFLYFGDYKKFYIHAGDATTTIKDNATIKTLDGADIVAGDWTFAAFLQESDVSYEIYRYPGDDGRVMYAIDDVADPPTDTELDTAFDTPANLGEGFIGIVNDNDADTDVWLVVTSPDKWWYIQVTEAINP